MTSSFSWLDHSEHDRRRALEVIDLLRRQDTRDQLGIGTIRDALSDLLAPGTSTIQTRARYFLFIPWMYQKLESRRVSASEVASKGRRAELALAKVLGAAEDSVGAIGAEAGKGLKRLPTAVYWAGLGTLGVRLFSGSQDQYHRALDRLYAEVDRSRNRLADGERAPGVGSRWHPHLPSPPDGFPAKADFNLTPEESVFLQDQIRVRAPETAFSFLVGWTGDVSVESAWWSPRLLEAYPPQIAAHVRHARSFSLQMHGAALLYNLMLAEAVPRQPLEERYEDQFRRWASELEEHQDLVGNWDRTEFWRLVTQVNTRIPRSSRRFAIEWMDWIADPGKITTTSSEARELIRRREHSIKRGRARLMHREYLLMWGGSAGADPLEYRWSTVRTILDDILRGLRTSKDHARAA